MSEHQSQRLQPPAATQAALCTGEGSRWRLLPGRASGQQPAAAPCIGSASPHRGQRRRAVLLSVTALALSACGLDAARAGPARQEAPSATADTPTATPKPSDQPSPAETSPGGPAGDEAAIATAIEQTLARRATALAAGDRAAFLATIDQRNLTWRRIQGDIFEASARRGPPDRYTVTRVQPKPDGYYKAWIDITPAGASRPARWVVWVFHRSDQGWLLAEPLNDELGTRRTLESEHFILAYYPWDDDVIDRMAAVAEQGHAKATTRLGIAPDRKVQLSVNPTYASHSGLQEAGVLAAYLSGTKSMILVRSLESYGAGSTAIGQRQEDRLLTAVTHEYTHLINDQIVPLVKEPEWMQEGLAVYVSDDLWPDVMRSALRAGRTVPLEKASDIISWKLDPAKGYTQADLTLAYAESGYAVAYFTQRFGQPAFFDLARAFAESRRWEESFRQVAGISWEQFQSDWLAWVRPQVGA